MKSFKQIIFTIVMISITQILWADAPVDNPARVQTPCGLSDDMNCFEDGKTAYAPEVNANFKVLYDRIQKIASGITISDNGNVGMGVPQPMKKLHVGGGGIIDELTCSIALNCNNIRHSSRMHISGDEELYILNKKGVVISNVWGGNGNLLIDGQIIMASQYPEIRTSSNDSHILLAGGKGGGPTWTSSGGIVYVSGANCLHNPHGVSFFTGDRLSVVIDKNSNVSITGTVTAQNFPTTSDIRFKKDIAPIKNSLTKTLALKPVYFNWKTDEYKEKNFSTKKQIGFIANDVETIIPESVHTDQKGIKYIDYGKITPVIVGAIQKLNTKISDLEKKHMKKISRLEKENSALKKMLAEYGQLVQRIALLEISNQKHENKSVTKVIHSNDFEQ